MKNKEVVTIEQNLRLLRQLAPDSYWQDSLRSTLLKQVVAVKKGRWSLTFSRRLSIALVLLIVFLTGGTGLLAQGSVPGDLLYPVKRGVEDFRLAFAGSEEKFIIQQELAEKRIAELKRVALARRYKSADPAIKEVENSISTVRQEALVMSTTYQTLNQEGKDTTPIKTTLSQLVPVIEQGQAELGQIESSLPETAQPRVVELRQSLEKLENQVKESLETTNNPQSTNSQPAPSQGSGTAGSVTSPSPP